MLPIRYSGLIADPSGEALLSSYAEECAIEAIGKPEPQAHMYQQMEEIGLLHGFGLYCDTILVGFCSLLMSVIPHYGKKVATMESIFVAKEHRGSVASARLMKTAEAFAELHGCVAILYSAPALSEFSQMLSGREEYQRTNSVFCRRLA